MSEVRPSRDDAPASTSKAGEVVAAAVDSLGQAGEDALVGRTVTINRPCAEFYAFWRRLTNMPRVLDTVVRIDRPDDRRSQSMVKAPAGKAVERDAVIARDGWDALMDGKASVVSDWSNKIEQAIANISPAGILVEQHRKMAGPGSADPEDLARKQARQ